MAGSLFIGRYQPFHAGHKALIETVLKEGRQAIVAVRDTPIDRDNLLTLGERVAMIREALREWEEQVTVIPIPDVAEVCYGRTPGWSVREIRLDAATEAISGTEVRKLRDYLVYG